MYSMYMNVHTTAKIQNLSKAHTATVFLNLMTSFRRECLLINWLTHRLVANRYFHTFYCDLTGHKYQGKQQSLGQGENYS